MWFKKEKNEDDSKVIVDVSYRHKLKDFVRRYISPDDLVSWGYDSPKNCYHDPQFRIMERDGKYITQIKKSGVELYPIRLKDGKDNCIGKLFTGEWEGALIETENDEPIVGYQFNLDKVFETKKDAVKALKKKYGSDIKILEGEWRQV
jgi:hypothetical protein